MSKNNSEIYNIVDMEKINIIEKQYILSQMSYKVNFVINIIKEILKENITYKVMHHYEKQTSSYNSKNNCFTTLDLYSENKKYLPFLTIFYDNNNIDYELVLDINNHIISETIYGNDLKTNILTVINNIYKLY